MTFAFPPEATEGAFGKLSTDAFCYAPLDTVLVRIEGWDKGDDRCVLRVCDPDQRAYFETNVVFTSNRGEVRFTAAGPLGNHYVYLIWPGEQRRHSRYVNFRLDCQTQITSGDADWDDLFPVTREAMLLGRREYDTPAGKFVGYISADTFHFDGIWLRDWIYGLPAYKYWERDMTCGLDRFLEAQALGGMIPDGIERDGRTWRVGLESDVEYILTLGVWQTWQTVGDDAWLQAALPRVEQALNYIRSDPKHWDEQHQLVKRQHSCDTWDFDIDGASDAGQSRHVIATCDQSGYCLAFQAMAAMYRHLGQEADAARWETEADQYRKRAVTLLWDQTKFLHHVHLDPIDHGDFDETNQLAMGNTWAMTRGLANPDQARSILDEYCRRQEATGDAYPWWSLQPGYPDSLGYFAAPHRQQGGYANGGLMPWVGGELCRAAFSNGRETYGVELLRQYVDHLRRTGGAQVWYWPDGTPGFRTPNEVPYAGWGMAQWLSALMEGLAGIEDSAKQLRHVRVSPRWAATPAAARDVRAVVRYAASNAYFAYRLQIERANHQITTTFCGSGTSAEFRVLLPPAWRPVRLTINGQETSFEQVRAGGDSLYVAFPAVVRGASTVVLECCEAA